MPLTLTAVAILNSDDTVLSATNGGSVELPSDSILKFRLTFSDTLDNLTGAGYVVVTGPAGGDTFSSDGSGASIDGSNYFFTYDHSTYGGGQYGNFSIAVNQNIVENSSGDGNESIDSTMPSFGNGSIYFNVVIQLPAAPICFPKGTPVTTDQGIVAIEKLNTDKHTIRGKEIVAITQSRPLQKHIVCFDKDALSKNVPSQQTLCSMEHKVFYKGEMMKARNIVDVCENVTFVPYNGETLFNVLLKKDDKMMINNLICETLHPKNIMAKISTMKDGQKKSKAIQELTKIIKENNIPEYQKLYASL